MSTSREQLPAALIESYKHRAGDGASCALCGATSLPLAFHALEASFDEGSATPNGFVPMSASRGRVRGSYPLCTKCAPPCSKCQLPRPSERILEFGYKLGAKQGIGMCEHIQFGLFVQALFKRLFGLGRFRKAKP